MGGGECLSSKARGVAVVVEVDEVSDFGKEEYSLVDDSLLTDRSACTLLMSVVGEDRIRDDKSNGRYECRMMLLSTMYTTVLGCGRGMEKPLVSYQLDRLDSAAMLANVPIDFVKVCCGTTVIQFEIRLL
jgi:hypothetical protein